MSTFMSVFSQRADQKNISTKVNSFDREFEGIYASLIGYSQEVGAMHVVYFTGNPLHAVHTVRAVQCVLSKEQAKPIL